MCGSMIGPSTMATRHIARAHNQAWAFFCLSIVLAVASIAYGFVDWRFFIGGIMVFAALYYYLSIRWVDRCGATAAD